MRRRELLKLAAAAPALASLRPDAATHPARRSHYRWRPRQNIRKPNIVIVVLDDVGFGDLGCYGAEHRTDCMDALAARGARFNNFHVTALCAPTRACLMTGMNAHAVGVGNIAEWGRDLPAYRGWIRPDAPTLGEILAAKGYTTLAIGKWHLSPIDAQNGGGPYDQWPNGRGFDRWYGFHGNAMDHWHPEMFENTVAARPQKGPDYHLSADLVDRSVDYVKDHLAATPEKPFFLYLAFGACHYPFHVPKADIERYTDYYSLGWDLVRQQRFERQQSLGLLPEGAELAPRNPGVPAWNDLSEAQKKVAAYGQQVYAAFLQHTDRQLARLVRFLAHEGELKDTIMVLMSDNGAAGGGGSVEGILDVRRAYYDDVTFDELADTWHLLGGDNSYGMYGNGWAQASNTPLKWYKADTYGGGIRAPLVISWPNGQVNDGGFRSQYTHVTDVAPTLLEMINQSQPTAPKGKRPTRMQGTSFAHALDHPTADTNKTVQYFETAGDRAVWANGWKAVAGHVQGRDYNDDSWELYHTDKDFSEIHDRAADNPEKLSELIELWRVAAKRDGVLPMADDLFGLYKAVVVAPRAEYVFFPGMTRLDRLSAPDLHTYNCRIRADVSIHKRNINGVILASGDSGAGYELLMQDGYLVFCYVYTRTRKYRARSNRRAGPEITELGVDVTHIANQSHRVTLLFQGDEVGNLHLPDMWEVYAPNSGVRCGENTHSPVSRMYEGSFAFEGEIARVTIELDLE